MTFNCKMCGLEFETGIIYFTVCEGCCDKIDSKELTKKRNSIRTKRFIVYKSHSIKRTHMFKDKRGGNNYTQCGVVLKEEDAYLTTKWNLVECKRCLVRESRVKK